MNELIKDTINTENTKDRIPKYYTDVVDILSQQIFPISQDQINYLLEIINKDYQHKFRQQRTDLNQALSKIGLKGELIDFSYNEESGKILILSKLSKSKHTAYLIDINNKEIKDLNLNIPFTGVPSWNLEFILPDYGFVVSTYNLDDESIDDSDNFFTYSDLGLYKYKYRVYDFDGKLLIDGNNWPKRMQNKNHENNIYWIRNQIERNNKI